VTLASQTVPISNAVTLLADGEREESLVDTDRTHATSCQDVMLSTTAVLVSPREALLVAPSLELELKVTAKMESALPLARNN